MYFTKNSAFAAMVALATGAQAHMFLASPPPFTSPQQGQAPLNGNFPCHNTGGVAYAGTSTSMAIGSTQKLSFLGVATHSGGSCQVSVTYDANPTKDSVWKVIHSIEGGCVADVEGNISEDGALATKPLPGGFDYPIPADLPAGKAVIAWTWLNRSGNREFYMGCSPVEFTGSGGDQASYDALPDMLVTNMPPNNNECGVDEGKDYKYPNPGKSVVQLGKAGRLIDLKCPAGTPGGTPGERGSSGGSTPQPSTGAGNGGSQPTTTAGSGSSPTKAPGGVFVPAPGTSAAPAASASPSPATPSQPASSQPASNPGTSNPGTGTGSGTGSGSSAGAEAAGSACSPEGTWNCIGGTKFQQCASGLWSAVQPMAAGMSCTAGKSATIQMAAAV